MILNEIEPSLEQWRELYAAAGQFRKIECWRWLCDSDLFGVCDPQTGMIAYCSVLGNLGELFALIVYTGDAALESYWKIAEGEVGVGDLEALVIRECLEASFGSRSQLDKRDLRVIKQLGLQFRGTNAWPCFRSHRKGCAPWFLVEDEARLLTLVLRQAREIALWVKDDPGKLMHETDEDAVFVRELVGGQWRDVWVTPQRSFQKELPETAPPVDSARAQAILALNCQRLDAWEADVFPIPVLIGRRDERPYFPYSMLCVSRASGLVLCAHMAEPHKRATEFQEHFLKMAQASKLLPQEVLVANRETYELFKLLGEALDFKVKLVKRLPVLMQARDSMLAMMQSDFSKR